MRNPSLNEPIRSSNNWKPFKIGDLLMLEYGKGLKDYQTKLKRYPVLGTNGMIGTSDVYIYDKPSLVIGRKGAYRGVHFVESPFFVIDTAFYTKNRTDLADTLFLFYWFRCIDINSMDSGSAIPSTSRDEVYDLDIELPSLPEQYAIAGVLHSLDDKIDLLHRQNKTLEAMAETLFRQWFVEEAGDVVPITHYVEFNPTRKLSKRTTAPYLDMGGVSTTTFNPTGWYDREFTSGTKFKNEDTLLARITPCLENGKSAFVTFLKKDQVGWGSTEFIVMRSKDTLAPFFTYALARNQDFRDYAEGCMAGSSGRQRVDVEHLKQFELGQVCEEAIQEFNRLVGAIPPKLHNNMLQISTLGKLRDTLLPKLMSGEVRVQYD